MKLLVTGAYGFIGSATARALLDRGSADLTLVDAAAHRTRLCVRGLESLPFIDRADLPARLPGLKGFDGVLHLGACTDTGQSDLAYLEQWNTEYTRQVFRWCTTTRTPLVYASSAATYGSGQQGYSDDHAGLPALTPLNPYGRSKHALDLWAIDQREMPPGWWGIKFFNVYGTGEAHKGRMASTIFHGYAEIMKTGAMTLFQSHRPDIPDGQQKRDFIHVDDVVALCLSCLDRRPPSGIYNCGTGLARPFQDVAHAIFKALGKPPRIEWTPTPEKYRAGYQYFTQADMTKSRGARLASPETGLESGVSRYVAFLMCE